MSVNLDSLLEAVAAAADETEFYARWQDEAGLEVTPFAMAVRGGAAAGGFAEVFSAGYQAALRVTFPDVEFAGWAAFVVSEDVGVEALPGVTCVEAGDDVVLNGYKTWIAACDVVDELVVRAADAAGGHRFFLVPRTAAGLDIVRNPNPSVLPGLSQGRAHFENVVAGVELDTGRVARFGIVEPFYIYLAFLSMAFQRFDDVALRDNIRRVLADVAELDPLTAPPRALAAFDHAVQNLRRGLVHLTDDLAWRADAKLISMYSKGMQKRL